MNTIVLVARASQQITIKRKDLVKSFLSEDYWAIYDQDHSSSKILLGDDLAHDI